MKKSLIILGLIFTVRSFAIPDTVVIIRHGEKPNPADAANYGKYQSLDNLSCMGVHRSIGLISYLQNKFPHGFEQIFVPSLTSNAIKGTTQEARMFEVIAPYASVVHRNIDSSYTKTDHKGVVNKIMQFDKGTSVLVVWEHHNIPLLAKQLGIANPPKWQDNDFDSVWVITGLGSGKPVLNTTNHNEKSINPSSSCDNF